MTNSLKTWWRGLKYWQKGKLDLSHNILGISIGIFSLILVFTLTNTAEEKAKNLECAKPEQWIGNRCCLPYENDNTMCKDEGEVFLEKFRKSVEENQISQNILLKGKDLNFSFVSPKDYYFIKDIEAGGQKVPYFFLKSLGYDENFCAIRITTIYSDELFNKNVENLTEYFIEVFEDEDTYKNVKTKSFTSNFDVKGYYLDYEDIADNKVKAVLFEDKMQEALVSLTFGCSMQNGNYDNYVLGYEEVVSSFKFE